MGTSMSSPLGLQSLRTIAGIVRTIIEEIRSSRIFEKPHFCRPKTARDSHPQRQASRTSMAGWQDDPQTLGKHSAFQLSSLINAFRGLRNRDQGAAPTGVVETTTDITRFPDPSPHNPFVWYMSQENIIRKSGYDSDEDEDENHSHRNALYGSAREQYIAETRATVKSNLQEANLARSKGVHCRQQHHGLHSERPENYRRKTIDELELMRDLFREAQSRRCGKGSRSQAYEV
ncbi:hypothetical protein DFJ58DRAFT_826395 [Suillus subalutaceus]|uniref:uncharacterized protein n=1 Tax=Suillus subalutaceus TaxID=48586 RepID=UPI001B880A35|nr:uncharacterized protein DFJ58DRAFT_826395 [Suillus subalutaceus]KAG1828896.1 hypothetical protein DFJ58DRAFT_826395 [Suillus subalutaceus]